MSFFNPAAILLNPALRTPGGFTIRRYSNVEDENGIVTQTYIDAHAEGVVVPSGNLGMVRVPEAEQQGSSITVYTQTPISSGNADINQPADEIIWHDIAYQVKSQDDWSDFGYNVAKAEMIDTGAREVA